MIELHRLDGEVLFVNMDLIEFIEETPDTVVTLTSANKFIVRERAHEIQQLVMKNRQEIFRNSSMLE